MNFFASGFAGSKGRARRILASTNQRRYALAEIAQRGSYMIAVGHEVTGRFDRERFLAACHSLVERHDALRTRFEIDSGQVFACIDVKAAFVHAVCRLEDDSFETFRDWALPLVFDDVDPRKSGSLVRFFAADYGDRWRFTAAAHHAITDGFSRNVINSELLKGYAGEEVAASASYYDAMAVTPIGDKCDQRLQTIVRSLPQPVRPFAKSTANRNEDEQTGAYVLRNCPAITKSMRVAARSIGVTKFAIFSAVYALGLSGATGATRLSSAFQSEGRKATGASNSIIGPFSNTLPLDLSFDPEVPFTSFASEVGDRVADVLHSELANPLDAAAAEGKAPFVSLNMYPPASRISAGELSVGPREFLDRRTEFDLNLVWSTEEGILNARLYYDPRRIETERAELFLAQQERLIAAVCEDPHRTCAEIMAAARAGNEAVFPAESDTPVPSKRLHEAVFEQAARAPGDTAIITAEKTITYGELDKLVRAYGKALSTAGCGDGSTVAILADRCPALVAAMLGASASGAAFAVVDAGYPEARISSLLEKLSPDVVLLAGSGVISPLQARARVLVPYDVNDVQDFRPVTGELRGVAYHLFTSGTTGEPKLISHPEATVLRFVTWQAELLGKQPCTTMMLAGLSHDPIMRDVLLPLQNGGTIAIPTREERADPVALRDLARVGGSMSCISHRQPAGCS